MKNKRNKWVSALFVIVGLTILSFFIAVFVSLFLDDGFESLDGNVAIIEISGPIVSQEDANLFFSDVTSSDVIRKLIRRADRNEKIKAIINV